MLDGSECPQGMLTSPNVFLLSVEDDGNGGSDILHIFVATSCMCHTLCIIAIVIVTAASGVAVVRTTQLCWHDPADGGLQGRAEAQDCWEGGQHKPE